MALKFPSNSVILWFSCNLQAKRCQKDQPLARMNFASRSLTLFSYTFLISSEKAGRSQTGWEGLPGLEHWSSNYHCGWKIPSRSYHNGVDINFATLTAVILRFPAAVDCLGVLLRRSTYPDFHFTLSLDFSVYDHSLKWSVSFLWGNKSSTKWANQWQHIKPCSANRHLYVERRDNEISLSLSLFAFPRNHID